MHESPPHREQPLRPWRALTRVAAAVIVLTSVATLAAWFARIPSVAQVGEGLAPMWPVTAIVFLLLGGGLVLRTFPWGHRSAAVIAGTTVLVACLLLLERLGISHLLPERLMVPADMPSPGRRPGIPSATVSLSFMLGGVALLLLHRPTLRRAWWANGLCAVMALSSVTALAGWVYGAKYLAGLPWIDAWPGISLQATLLFIVVSFAIPSAEPRLGGMAVLSSERLGGYLSRRLVVAAALIPLAGLVIVSGARGGHYGVAAAAAWVSVLALALAVGLVIALSARLNALDAQRAELLRQTEEARAWLETMMRTSPAGVMRFHQDGTIVFNHEAERIFGRPLVGSEGSAQYLGQVLFPDGRPVPRAELPSSRVLTRGDVLSGEEFLIRPPEGPVRPILVWAGPIRDDEGRLVGGAGLLFDITSIKQLEQQLRAAVGARDQLLRVVSHDLRNPMNAISLSFGRMVIGSDVPEAVRRAADRGQRAVKQMQRLVEDLLDFERLGSEELRVSPRPLLCAELLGQVSELFADAAKEAGVALVVSAGPEGLGVRADPDRLLQVFSNLVGNALKFTPAGGHVRVWAEPEGEDSVRMGVEDSGCGMTPEQTAHAFESFWQAAQGDRRGLGIGLPIARAIVEAHGSVLELASMKDMGTTFTFALERVAALQPEEERAAEAGAVEPPSVE